MSESGFEYEAVKLMISDISKAREVEDGIFEIKLSSKELGFKSSSSQSGVRTIPVRVAWIQGNIRNIREDVEDSSKLLVVQDGTSEAIIAGYDIIPGGDHEDIKSGGYVGILGHIISTQPEIGMKAVKIMVLNDKPDLKAMWADEVRDLKAFLLDQYSSWNGKTT